MTSPTAGYVTIKDEPERDVLCDRKSVAVPADRWFMASFRAFEGYGRSCRGSGVYDIDSSDTVTVLWSECVHALAPLLFRASKVIVQMIVFKTDCRTPRCLKMLFSFHLLSETPRRVLGFCFNCSVHYFVKFKQHLSCNLKPECADERDEGDRCYRSVPACQGWIDTEHTCYKLITGDTFKSFARRESNVFKAAKEYCNFLGSSLAAPKDYYGWKQLIDVFFRLKTSDILPPLIGVYFGDMSVPNMYRRTLTSDDRTVLYNMFRPVALGESENQKSCSVYSGGVEWVALCNTDFSLVLKMTDFERKFKQFSAVCEKPKRQLQHNETMPDSVSFPNVDYPCLHKGRYTICQNGHVTLTFLACGPQNVCGQGRMVPCVFSNTGYSDENGVSTDQRVTSVALFACDDSEAHVSYSLLCDFRHDCDDKSDEDFCKHPLCEGFTCTSGQCVSFNQRCDMLSDCFDQSDEANCLRYRAVSKVLTFPPPPALVDFDGVHDFIVTKMNPNASCPDTHYRCPGDFNNCVPTFTRCNGMYDCIHHEDEDGCEEWMCPGFFRCQFSSICVHGDHLCDGWPHCPRRDDELFCAMICPEVCLCHGHAFVCAQSFSADVFPDIRYLDGTSSGMTLSALSNNPYLVHLSLAKCSLESLTDTKLSNLRLLDLADNKLQHVDMAVFAALDNLRTLSLANNPLTWLSNDPTCIKKQKALKTLDLSHTKMTVFDSQVLSHLESVRSLDLSYTTIHTINSDGFKFLPYLATLRMKGSPVKTFSPDLFKDLLYLRSIYADSYKICCSDILPSHFEQRLCHAPTDEVSSCDDLLHTGIYRGFLWIIGCLSLAGNLFCFTLRLCVQKTSVRVFSVFVANLSIADFLMGVCIAIIGVADKVYLGRYLYYDSIWTGSVACQVAGFLSLLSTEVSAMTIWLITLDRFIVLHFTFSTFRFTKTSATAVNLVSWAVGLLLALTPLMPLASHWEFYGQTGICIPLPVTRRDFKGRMYSFSVLIVFNFVLFFLITAGQAFVYWSVQNTLTSSTTRLSQDMTIARKLITVAVTDFLCWFPIRLCGFLALTGVPIPGEVNVALAIFALPLNAALNPFVYTFNTLVEKRRKLNEAKLLKWLEAHPTDT